MLHHLALRGNRCSDAVAESIAMSLETNLQLKSLNVCRNAFSDQGVTALLRALKFNNSIKTVSLAENNAGDAVCATVQLLLIGFEVRAERSEEHTSELQSLMRTSYAVFCFKNTK